jgi:hypothetical protein
MPTVLEKSPRVPQRPRRNDPRRAFSDSGRRPLACAPRSVVEYAKTLAGDILLTYLLHPGTALYVGCSNLLENYNLLALGQAARLERSAASVISTAAGLFVKFSYLYRF